MSETKHCNHCDTTKPLSEFYLQKNGKIRPDCKDCLRKKSREGDKGRYQRDPVGGKKRRAEWMKKHPDAARQYAREGMRKLRQGKKDVGQTMMPLNDPKAGIAARRAKKDKGTPPQPPAEQA